MNARHKLNAAAVNGSLLIAAAAGLITGSVIVFLVMLVLCLALGLSSSDIRVDRRDLKRRR